MFRDIREFLAALTRQWVIVLTGGVVVAAIALGQFVTGKSLPPRPQWALLLLLYGVATFRAWREQWTRASRTMPEIALSELTELAHAHTEVAFMRLIRPYIGMRVKVTGSMRSLLQPRWWLGMVELEVKGQPSIYLSCPFWTFRTFVPLPVGTTITVIGRIQSVNRIAVILEDVAVLGLPQITERVSS